MSKLQISFIFDKDTDEVTDVQCVVLGGRAGVAASAPVVNNNAKIELKGSSLILNDDILAVLRCKINSKLVLKVENGQAQLINPKLEGKVKGGNVVTGKQTISCRGKNQDDLKALGTIFGFKLVKSGVINLIPVTGSQDVLQITEDTDSVISEEEIEALYNDDEETVTDTFDLES